MPGWRYYCYWHRWHQRDPQSDGKIFGHQRLEKIIDAHAQDSAQTLQNAIVAAVVTFRGNLAQEDDITLVVIKVVRETD